MPQKDVGIPSYTALADKLDVAWRDIHESHTPVPDKVRNSLRNSDNAKTWVEAVIENHNSLVGEWPKPGIGINEHCLNLIYEAVTEADREMPGYEDKQQEEANEIDRLTTQLENRTLELEKVTQQLKETRQQLEEVSSGDGGAEKPSWDPEDLGDWPVQDGLGASGGSAISDDWAMDDELSSLDENSGSTDETIGEQDPGGLGLVPDEFEADPSEPTMPSSQGMGSAFDSTAGLMNSLWPAIAGMNNPMMRQPYEQYPPRPPEGVEPRETIVAPPAVAPPPPAPAAAPPNPAAPVPPPSQPAVASSGAPAQPAGNGMPPRTPGTDGAIDYTFPDGEVQKVPAVVAQALDSAFSNASGTDAQAAYAQTPAKWSDKKQIGDRVGPSELKTGDVADWKNRTALLRVLGPDGGDRVEAIVEGQLQHLVAEQIDEITDSGGEFGPFAGFVHPRGLETAAAESDSGVPATVPPSDEPAGPAAPVEI
ncbi:hypothetical protein DFR68_113116 [Nocardia mexicana]|uniref:Uncharacterized protein n=1 Tax=Nocardia mexicana TaxID=279262 RepID=A0A370GNP2_9NOCA|nr:hypothetical protein DFR68_113116 [Nocardia mexicana]